MDEYNIKKILNKGYNGITYIVKKNKIEYVLKRQKILACEKKNKIINI